MPEISARPLLSNNAPIIKVLHLPYNVASSTSITVNNLNSLPGIQAKGLILSAKHDFQSSKGLTYLQNRSGTFGLTAVYHLWKLYFYMKWADILHWYWDSSLPFNLDLKLASLLKKPIIIQWQGSDIRNPDIVSKNNIFYETMYREKLYEYAELENAVTSYKRQLKFSKFKAIPIIYPDLNSNIRKELFPRYYQVRHRIDVFSFIPLFPDPHKSKPLVVHICSSHYSKGTNYVLNTIEKLKHSLEFDFILITGMKRENALEILKIADIVLDQFVIGEHGLAAIEAMSYGKPVFTFLRKDIHENMPSDCPILNTSPDQLFENLSAYIKDGEARYQSGVLSRSYVEKYHDSQKIILEIQKIYEDVLQQHSSK